MRPQRIEERTRTLAEAVNYFFIQACYNVPGGVRPGIGRAHIKLPQDGTHNLVYQSASQTRPDHVHAYFVVETQPGCVRPTVDLYGAQGWEPGNANALPVDRARYTACFSYPTQSLADSQISRFFEGLDPSCKVTGVTPIFDEGEVSCTFIVEGGIRQMLKFHETASQLPFMRDQQLTFYQNNSMM